MSDLSDLSALPDLSDLAAATVTPASGFFSSAFPAVVAPASAVFAAVAGSGVLGARGSVVVSPAFAVASSPVLVDSLRAVSVGFGFVSSIVT